MRVLMTGGYGCIGSWVAKHWSRRGREVWIYDLKEDTHRLELLIDPRAARQVHHLPGDVADGGGSDRPSSVGDDPYPASRRLAGADLPGRSDPRGDGQRDRHTGRLRGGRGAAGAGRAGRLRQLGRGPRPARADAPGPLVGDEVRLLPTTHYGAFKVCNELNARVYWLDQGITSVGLRPWTVYGVGRDFGVTSEPTKAIKAVAAGRPYQISYGGLQDFQYTADVAATFLRALDAPFKGAEAFNVRGAVAPIEAFVASLGDVAPEASRLITHGDRQLPISPSLDDSRLQACLGPLPSTPLHQGIADTYDRFRQLHAEGRLSVSDLPD